MSYLVTTLQPGERLKIVKSRYYFPKAYGEHYDVRDVHSDVKFLLGQLEELQTELAGVKEQRHAGHVAIEKFERREQKVRDALLDPYKRASLQNALNVLSSIDQIINPEQYND